MIFEQVIDNRDDPILVSTDNGGRQFKIYRNTKKNKTLNFSKFLIKSLCSFLFYIVDSVFVGLKGLVK